MTTTDKDTKETKAEASPFDRRAIHALFELARQYKRQFIIVSIFSFLYTGLDLLQPLVYREAINAVAGLFVTQVSGSARSIGVVAHTPEQTLRTLLISVALLFCIAVVS